MLGYGLTIRDCGCVVNSQLQKHTHTHTLVHGKRIVTGEHSRGSCDVTRNYDTPAGLTGFCRRLVVSLSPS